ncbi:penicillin-binding protein [Granulicatella balaenopterae]|uniref:Penicillin-binding protein n=1 Tax=Granulicatella balaenopterae TaxID=137733 RepID=A0A1H9H8L5_9LACT|nr:transglycosylase domain-containing protein [Granulicatella balaenopterae]SEQ58597.1 penicillin-binding protein [Granulicatella balaenopterae]
MGEQPPNNAWRTIQEKYQQFSNDKRVKEGVFKFNIAYSAIKNIFLVVVLFIVLMGCLGGGIGLGYFASLTAHEVPMTPEQMEAAVGNVDLVSTYFYQDGEKVTDVRSDNLRTITRIEDISPYVQDGIIATEDSYFYEHPGIVPKALVRAVLQEFMGSGGAKSGGSTLTQQLVKQQILSSEVTFKRKANEILYALRLENYFTKDQILEAYLNVSPFGRNRNGLNVSGIEEAARGVFGVTAKDLTLPQAAYLVGMPQNPIVYTPYTNFATMKDDVSAGINRMKIVLYSMYREHKITKEQYEEALAYDITKDFLPAEEVTTKNQTYLYQALNRETIKIIIEKNAARQKLSYQDIINDRELYSRYYDNAMAELSTAGYRIHTTIDKAVYDAMQNSIQSYGSEIGPTYTDKYIDPNTGETKEKDEMAQNGAVLIENKTGKILGFIAGRDFHQNQVDHAFTTKRSPGSTIKPLLVYAPAIENNIIAPATVIPDTEISILQADGSYWKPTNVGNMISNTWVTARFALTHSYNLPTIKIFQAMLDKGIFAGDYLAKMGIKGIKEEEYQNLALSIGGTVTGPTVVEQTSAFTTLANKGKYIEQYMIELIEDSNGNIIYQHQSEPVEVFSEATAYIVTDILRGVTHEASYYNVPYNLGYNEDIAAKTGTSEFELDNWYIGYTPEVTLGSWIGYDNAVSTTRHAITAADGYGMPTIRSVRNWTHILKSVYDAKPSLATGEKFIQPDTVYRTSVLGAVGKIDETKSEKDEDDKKQPVSNHARPSTITDLFKTDFGPDNPNYSFALGATKAELEALWKKEEKKDEKSSSSESSSSESSSSQSSESSADELDGIVPKNPDGSYNFSGMTPSTPDEEEVWRKHGYVRD